jgi:hypothetical protein
MRRENEERSRTFKKFFARVDAHPKFKQKGEHDSFSTDRRSGKAHRDAVAIELRRTLALHNA